MKEPVRIVVAMVLEFEGVSEEEARASAQDFLRRDPDQPGPKGLRHIQRMYQLSDSVKAELLEEAAAHRARSETALRKAHQEGTVRLPRSIAERLARPDDFGSSTP